MSISIVIVTYNSRAHLDGLLSSIIDQKYDLSKIQIIIVDNNSLDKKQLSKITHQYSNDLQVLLKLRNRNYGFASSCNYGANFAKYSNILFLNPDITLDQFAINIMLDHLNSSRCAVVGGKARITNQDGVHRTIFNKVNLRTMLFEFSNLGKLFNIDGNFYINQNYIKNDTSVDGVGGGYLLIKRSIFKELSGFDEGYFMYLEDVDLCLRVTQSGRKIIYCPHSEILHIGGASSNNKHRIRHSAWYDSREYYAKKHFSFLISVLLIALYKVERFLLVNREKIYDHIHNSRIPRQ